jgi:hypothetical protein
MNLPQGDTAIIASCVCLSLCLLGIDEVQEAAYDLSNQKNEGDAED